MKRGRRSFEVSKDMTHRRSYTTSILLKDNTSRLNHEPKRVSLALEKRELDRLLAMEKEEQEQAETGMEGRKSIPIDIPRGSLSGKEKIMSYDLDELMDEIETFREVKDMEERASHSFVSNQGHGEEEEGKMSIASSTQFHLSIATDDQGDMEQMRQMERDQQEDDLADLENDIFDDFEDFRSSLSYYHSSSTAGIIDGDFESMEIGNSARSSHLDDDEDEV